MFDLAWSEIALIAVVALVVIGPKDLPGAIRGVAEGIKKMRKMAGEFQQQADELVREAKLDDLRNQIHDVRSTLSDIRNFDLRDQIEKHVDKDGTLRGSLTDTMGDNWTPPPVAPTDPSAPPAEAPAFVPPAIVEMSKPPPPPPPPVEAPAFVPPTYAPPTYAPSAPAAASLPPVPTPEPARPAAGAV